MNEKIIAKALIIYDNITNTTELTLKNISEDTDKISQIFTKIEK